eukprot:scaffold36187_cov32-Tisochrysis_lutea.AAC.2
MCLRRQHASRCTGICAEGGRDSTGLVASGRSGSGTNAQMFYYYYLACAVLVLCVGAACRAAVQPQVSSRRSAA